MIPIRSQIYFTFVALKFTNARNLRPSVLDPFVPSVDFLHVIIHVSARSFEGVVLRAIRTVYNCRAFRSLRNREFFDLRIFVRIIVPVFVLTDIPFVIFQNIFFIKLSIFITLMSIRSNRPREPYFTCAALVSMKAFDF